jgi:hypothetical protein
MNWSDFLVATLMVWSACAMLVVARDLLRLSR